MQVKEIMTKGVITVKATDPIKDVGKLFKEKRISGVPVINDQDEIVGIVTVTDMLKIINDIYRWSKLEQKTPNLNISGEFEKQKEGATVERYMTKDVLAVEENTDMQQIFKLMFEKKVHSIPVVVDNKLVGIVGVRDVIASCI